jgi:hypothetical protein|tara:strand:- start:146 stop:427 length:282 start_codon:yes stop_codon:yes gene_type:complete
MVGKVQSIDYSSSVTGVVTIRDQTDAEAAEGVSSTEIRKRVRREERTQLLIDTDWMSMGDVTMSDAWKTYRQALRDLPAADGYPDVDMPTKPS